MTTTKFKNSQNIRYLQGLFYEQTRQDKTTVVYTLKDEPHMGYPSLYRLYMDAMDPTEYNFATRYLDGWDHWEMLCSCAWFQPYVARWRKELALKIKADNIQRIMDEAESKSKNAFMAQKFLATQGYLDEPKQPRGRPSKENQKQAAKEAANEAFRLKDDFARISDRTDTKELN